MSICGIRIIPRNLWRSEMTAHYWMFPSREGSRDLKSMQPLYKRDPGQLLHCKSLFKFIASRAAGFGRGIGIHLPFRCRPIECTGMAHEVYCSWRGKRFSVV